MLLFSWLLSSSAQASQCSTPFALVMLENKLNSANESLARGDLKSFNNQIDSVNYSIPCIIQPLDKLTATKLHLLIGLNYWIDVKTDVAENHFSSVKSLKQTTQIPSTWLPNDTQLRSFFDKVKSSSDVQTIPVAPEGVYYFDGVQTNQQPLYRPVVFQYVIDNRVVQTKILLPGEKIPSLPTKSPTVTDTNTSSSETSIREIESSNYVSPTSVLPSYDKSLPGTPNWYLVGSSLSTGLTLGLIRTARKTRQSWESVEYVYDDSMQESLDNLWNTHKGSKRMAWVFGLGTVGLTYMGLQEWSSFDFDLASLLPSKKKNNISESNTAEQKIPTEGDSEDTTETNSTKSSEDTNAEPEKTKPKKKGKEKKDTSNESTKELEESE